MYLAAGLGERMRPLTDDRPKPLVALAGRPIIDYALERLHDAGVARVVVNLHYRGAMLREYLRQCREPEIIFSDESDELLGPGGGVVKALAALGNEPFYIHNCDSFWRDGNGNILRAMAQAFDPARMDALLLLSPLTRATGFDGPGDYTLYPEGGLRRNREKGEAPFAYCGVQIAHPRLFAGAPAGPFSPVALWDRAEREGRLFGTVLDAPWFHVGTPDALRLTEQFLARQ